MKKHILSLSTLAIINLSSVYANPISIEVNNPPIEAEQSLTPTIKETVPTPTGNIYTSSSPVVEQNLVEPNSVKTETSPIVTPAPEVKKTGTDIVEKTKKPKVKKKIVVKKKNKKKKTKISKKSK